MKLLTISPVYSCVAVVMVHVIKGHQYSAYTVPHAGASVVEMESETDSQPRYSDKFPCFNCRDELNSAVQFPNLISVVDTALCISYITGARAECNISP
jgi:hypothetical protein